MFRIEQRRLIAPLFCHGTVTGRLIFDVFTENREGSAIGVAQNWMQILFKLAQFWMPFNTQQIKSTEDPQKPNLT
jgi:hypothetical protein